jgi:hypothetical protein
MGFAPEYHGYRFMQDAAPNGGEGEGLRILRDGDRTVDIGRVYAH